ncbi:MAG TPA: hypothetical protein VK897_13055 [Anaerolineales bacterium]|nr:hypothetical protein [Anaerolineales bacterium]
MSMPMPLSVVVVSSDSQIAGIAAAVLRGDNAQSFCPEFAAAYAGSSKQTSSFYVTGIEHKFNIEIATRYTFIDVRRVDLWLALDSRCAEAARTYIMHNGPAPDRFYRGVFRDTVSLCGFDTPPVPWDQERLDSWLTALVKNLTPWRERIWDAFRDSS